MPVINSTPYNTPSVVGWSLSSAIYDNKSFTFSYNSVSGTKFNSTGTKLYVLNNSVTGDNRVYQHSLSTPWDVSTINGTADGSLLVTGQTSNTFSIGFDNENDNKIYVIDFSAGVLYQYNMSSPSDITTASYSGNSFNPSEMTSFFGIGFKTDGAKVYLTDRSNSIVYQYTLVTPWDISTASYDSKSLDLTSLSVFEYDTLFRSDGKRMFLVDTTDDYVRQYTLSVAWDISTASYDSIFLYVGTQEGTPTSIDAIPDGTKLYVSGTGTDSIYQYSMTA